MNFIQFQAYYIYGKKAYILAFSGLEKEFPRYKTKIIEISKSVKYKN